MTIDSSATMMAAAKNDFQRARSQAIREQVRARLSGESAELLSYEDTRRTLKATGSTWRGLQDIPLSAIVGSVGRCSDFTRAFLPRKAIDEERWARVQTGMMGSTGLPPIDVYQIGDVYFVEDGNHRVSVSRQLGATHIQAYVTEVRTSVPLTPDVRPDDLILKAEYAEFLERTHLDRLRPHVDLSTSVPGQYPKLEEHISVHRYFMGIEQKREVSYSEAVGHWYDTVYLPVIQAIRDQKLLRDFPSRTEADLYLWVSEHRTELEQELGWEIGPETATRDVAAQFSPQLRHVLSRFGERVLEPAFGPPPGKWRQQQQPTGQGALFTDVLIPISGRRSGWQVMEQALEVLQYGEGRLLGLHVVPSEEERGGEEVQAIEAEFTRRCEAATVRGTFVVDVGGVASRICERAQWTDLVVVGLAHPPGDTPIARLSSGFRRLVQHCPSPVLAVPELGVSQGRPTQLGSILLAYDGSARATEALYLATYLASRGAVALTVLTVEERRRAAPTPLRATKRLPLFGDGLFSGTARALIGLQGLMRAQKYLEEHGVQATFVTKQGSPAEVILETTEDEGSAVIIMGGYGFGPPAQIVLGSTVDQVLRQTTRPVLICQ